MDFAPLVEGNPPQRLISGFRQIDTRMFDVRARPAAKPTYVVSTACQSNQSTGELAVRIGHLFKNRKVIMVVQR